MTPKKLPYKELVTTTEVACRYLPPNEASEVRAKALNILSKPRRLDNNLSQDEVKALSSLRDDKSIKILPADKGQCAVVLNTEDYVSKCQDLLNDTNT